MAPPRMVGVTTPAGMTRFETCRLRRFWCKQARSVDDGRMQPFGPVEALFKGRHFDGQIIVLCVSWYTSFKLSLRDLVIMMADRGIRLTHTTILRWVQHYLPEFEKRWNRYARPVGGWRHQAGTDLRNCAGRSNSATIPSLHSGC